MKYNQHKCVKPKFEHPQLKKIHFNGSIQSKNYMFFHNFCQHHKKYIFHEAFFIWEHNSKVLLENQMLQHPMVLNSRDQKVTFGNVEY
jgi:hypothetical protein